MTREMRRPQDCGADNLGLRLLRHLTLDRGCRTPVRRGQASGIGEGTRRRETVPSLVGSGAYVEVLGEPATRYLLGRGSNTKLPRARVDLSVSGRPSLGATTSLRARQTAAASSRLRLRWPHLQHRSAASQHRDRSDVGVAAGRAPLREVLPGPHPQYPVGLVVDHEVVGCELDWRGPRRRRDRFARRSSDPLRAKARRQRVRRCCAPTCTANVERRALGRSVRERGIGHPRSGPRARAGWFARRHRGNAAPRVRPRHLSSLQLDRHARARHGFAARDRPSASRISAREIVDQAGRRERRLLAPGRRWPRMGGGGAEHFREGEHFAFFRALASCCT